MGNHYMEDDIQTPEDALHMIRCISLDHDGYRKAESLRDLIDELNKIAVTGLWRSHERGD